MENTSQQQQQQGCVLLQHSMKTVSKCGSSDLSNTNIWHMSLRHGKFLARIFVLFNLIGQLGGCVMIIGRFWVTTDCEVLSFTVILQTFTYSILWDLQFPFHNLILIGPLLLPGSILTLLVTIRYKTKLSALMLLVLLWAYNFYHNAWRNIPSYKPLTDFLKYDFLWLLYHMVQVAFLWTNPRKSGKFL